MGLVEIISLGFHYTHNEEYLFSHLEIMHNERKGHMQTAKVQISLLFCAVLSGPSLFVYHNNPKYWDRHA